MKFAKIYWMSFIVSMIFFSCSKVKPDVQEAIGENSVKIVLSTENAIRGNIHQSSEQQQSISKEGHTLRFVLEVYEQGENGNLDTKISRQVKLTPDFSIKLTKGKTYTFLAWADYVNTTINAENTDDQYYVTNPLTNVQIIQQNHTLNNSARDAFCAKVNGFSLEKGNTIDISMKRPLALLNIKESNKSDVKSLKLMYPSVYTGFNVGTGDVTGSKTSISITSATLPDNNENILAYDYLFVHPLAENTDPQKGSSLYDIQIEASKQENFNEADRKWAIQYVPFSPNYRTNLTTNFRASSGQDVSISLDQNFESLQIEGNQTFLVSSYIRNAFYQNFDRITDESMFANNDLIMIAFKPYLDGSIYYELPENDASFTNASHLSDFQGRNGVMSFNGMGAVMNAKNDLLNDIRHSGSDGSFRQFTFGTWLYVEEWTPQTYLFKKEGNNNLLACRLGDNQGDIVFEINNHRVNINATAIRKGAWHHFALAYHGNKSGAEKLVCFVDGNKVEGVSVASGFPNSIPFIRSNFHIASNLKGKIDETFVNSLYLPQGVISNFMKNGISLRNTDWNSVKTLAYWKYDEVANPGKDVQSWKSIYDEVRNKIGGKDIKLRLGISGGAWKDIIKNATNRTNLANSLYQEISKNKWDGVDFDFEWCTTPEEFSNYSALIVETGQKLKPLGVTFSVSLHPVSYRISQAAIDIADFISLQVYGPRPYIFPYEKVVESTEAVVTYGIPKNKLVMGLPFYGAESNNQGATASYYDFVKEGLISAPNQDEVVYKGKTYTFNGQETIRRKVNYVKQQQLLGVMSWDIATDAAFSNNLSLLRAVKEELVK